MKKIVLFLVLIGWAVSLQAQRYFTRNGTIVLYSSTPLEDIRAENKTVTAIFDAKTGDIQFAVTIKSFRFEKALMEEHFNENYMESDMYPKATFKGVIENVEEIDFEKEGKYTSIVRGSLTIHGVAEQIRTDATFTVKGDEVLGEAKIHVNPEDYGIKIPGIVRQKIAKELEVTITMNFKEKK